MRLEGACEEVPSKLLLGYQHDSAAGSCPPDLLVKTADYT